MCFTLLIVILCLAPLALYINLIVRDVITAASPILEKIGVTERELKVWQQSLFGTFFLSLGAGIIFHRIRASYCSLSITLVFDRLFQFSSYPICGND